MTTGKLGVLLAVVTCIVAIAFTIQSTASAVPQRRWQYFVATLAWQAFVLLVAFNMVWDDRYSGQGRQRVEGPLYYAVAMTPVTFGLWRAFVHVARQDLAYERGSGYVRRLITAGLLYLPGLLLVGVSTVGTLG